MSRVLVVSALPAMRRPVVSGYAFLVIVTGALGVR
jgi:hypothetical protein